MDGDRPRARDNDAGRVRIPRSLSRGDGGDEASSHFLSSFRYRRGGDDRGPGSTGTADRRRPSAASGARAGWVPGGEAARARGTVVRPRSNRKRRPWIRAERTEADARRRRPRRKPRSATGFAVAAVGRRRRTTTARASRSASGRASREASSSWFESKASKKRCACLGRRSPLRLRSDGGGRKRRSRFPSSDSSRKKKNRRLALGCVPFHQQS
mmetsp:Transcript_24043/g.56737  ORF Transcript_24043/g.56737 Transcript_24043/m.56737 type:complete len:213 (-) Transcript_24043:209-847(-)